MPFLSASVRRGGYRSLLVAIASIVARNPHAQVITTDGATFVACGNFGPASAAGPMGAPRRNITVHGAVPYIWVLVADRALVWFVQRPEAVPFRPILSTELRCDEGAVIGHWSGD